jgi:hypothetical protein
MRISIDVNGVLRDTLGKIEQIYQKFFIEDYVKEENEEEFEYSMDLPVTSIDLINHFKFKNEEDLFSFLYVDFPMNIFGHAGSSENSTFHVLNEIYLDLRDSHDLNIISDEIGKSKPATLFFLSKYGCQLETVKFYSTITEDWVWNNSDIILTSNPKLLEKKVDGKILVKYETSYNTESYSDYSIKSLEEFKELYKTLNLKQND